MRMTGRRIGLPAGLLAGLLLFAACNDDGRALRPARPDQVASVSTTAPDDTALPSFDDPDATITLPAEDIDSTATTTVAGSAPVLTASWKDGGAIDTRHTCDGAGVSPALRWTPAPPGTIEIAVSVTDDDAPGYIHWVIAALDPLSTSLGEGQVPEFALQATNSAGTVGWIGPCPPAGETHRYRFTVHYLVQQTELADASPASDLLAFVEAASFTMAELTANYTRT